MVVFLAYQVSNIKTFRALRIQDGGIRGFADTNHGLEFTGRLTSIQEV